MVTLLLIFVIVMDLLLIGLVYFMSKQKFNPVELLKEINNERRLLKEMREGIQIEIDGKYQKIESLYKKINAIAAEAELEVKNSSESLSQDMAEVLENSVISSTFRVIRSHVKRLLWALLFKSLLLKESS